MRGKPLKDHLEALDHYDAIRYVRELARAKSPLTESHVRDIHRLVVQRSRPDIAGRYADLARYVRTETGRFEFPSPAEIPALMGDFAKWLGATADTPGTAFTAHRRLVDIHPFNDGNGRRRAPSDEPDPHSWRLSSDCSEAGRSTRLHSGLAAIAGWRRDARCSTTLLYMRLDATLGEYLESSPSISPHAPYKRFLSGRIWSTSHSSATTALSPPALKYAGI